MEAEPGPSWTFVAKEGVELDADTVAAIANEAMAAAPDGVLEGGELLPRVRPSDASCRICGATEELSREHIPPRSAGNSDTHHSHSITEWLERDSLEAIPGGRHQQGGTFGYVLCRRCNSRTGKYAREYGGWTAMGARLFVEQLRPVDEMDQELVTRAVSIGVPRCHPAKFARQVLSMMVSLAGPWPLTRAHPSLLETLLEGTPCQLPDELTLDMALCAPVAARYAGPTLVVDLERQSWRWIVSLAYPPFAFEMELARSPGEHALSPLCGIGNFLEYENEVVGDVELELMVAFAHTAFPTDWRNRAQIESGRDLYGRLPTEL